MSESIKMKLNYEARRFYSRHPGRFRVIYPGYGAITNNNGEPQLRRRAKEETLRLLCVANDRPIKGLRVLLDAVETHLRSTNWQLELVGQCGEAIKKRVRESTALSSRVNLNGFRSDLPYFYQAAHIYIQPTLAPGEGIGNSIAEAMSFGLPVITSNVGGGTELIEHERSGLHFKSGDPIALARAIERLAEHPNLCNTLGITAFDELKKRFSLKNEAEGFLTVFRELIGEQRQKFG
jgi:glycosyltransferase involved in cell wall biosynthesis